MVLKSLAMKEERDGAVTEKRSQTRGGRVLFSPSKNVLTVIHDS